MCGSLYLDDNIGVDAHFGQPKEAAFFCDWLVLYLQKVGKMVVFLIIAR